MFKRINYVILNERTDYLCNILPFYVISVLAIAGVIVRPFKWPEAIWAITGAFALTVFGFLPVADGLKGIGKGTDVYFFLTGMMLLAETARQEKLFDWFAALATKMANGSAARLFLLIFLVGIAVTIFLSNDATAVVLTPAVATAAKAANAKKPLPFLFICAFVANAASFILPVSNPANLVIYGTHMPPLLHWLQQYIIPSIATVSLTYFILRFTQRTDLKQEIANQIAVPILSGGGKVALGGIAVTSIVLLVSSALDMQLGVSTAITGALTMMVVLIKAKKSPVFILKGVSWSVLPLVAGLFVIVEALTNAGLTQNLTALLNHVVKNSQTGAIWISGAGLSLACNFMNNLPVGLIAGKVIQNGHFPEAVKSAVLIGVDLGPNLSVTGSLATILWLTALRREKINISAWTFLKIGAVVMIVALTGALASYGYCDQLKFT